MNPVYSPVQPGTPYGNPKNMAYAGYPAGYPQTPTYTPNLYQTGSPGYPPVLLVKQGWPQASGAAVAPEGSYDLAMDAGSEGRQYQASAAAFSKYDPIAHLLDWGLYMPTVAPGTRHAVPMVTAPALCAILS
ncbi:protein FAM168A-like [Salvelinus namaycush]|uniref:Protein FAM168A-like n=1 Tax=Salvelinus namaycush TaxID=8040 RepID=A0A8U1BNY8_SALNM|nr:protein FAM168A-like [Salvelinus namaycush]